jgi:hypothetical protein
MKAELDNNSKLEFIQDNNFITDLKYTDNKVDFLHYSN